MPKPGLNGLKLHKLSKNNRKLKLNPHLPPLLINLDEKRAQEIVSLISFWPPFPWRLSDDCIVS